MPIDINQFGIFIAERQPKTGCFYTLLIAICTRTVSVQSKSNWPDAEKNKEV